MCDRIFIPSISGPGEAGVPCLVNSSPSGLVYLPQGNHYNFLSVPQCGNGWEAILKIARGYLLKNRVLYEAEVFFFFPP